MKRYIYGFFALLTTLLGAWALTGCTDDVELFMPEPDCFSLVVTVPEEASTRAASADSFNEFKVTTLHFYFYKSAGHDDAASLSVYDCVWTGEFDTQETVRVALPVNALQEGGLFGLSGTECIVYTVANVDEATLPDGPQKIDDLKKTALGSTFAETRVQDSFAMDGKATVTLARDERRATGNIELTRAAAKITLSVDLPETITVKIDQGDGTTTDRVYTSNAGNMHVWIGNGVKNSLLNTAAAEAAEADLYSNTIEAVENQGTAFARNEAAEKYKYVQNVPFYSYPNQWEATTPSGNCYLTLLVYWTYTDENGNTVGGPTYYRIAVQPKECKIERNMHYDIRATIGRIGSSEPQKPVDVTVEWNYAVPWNTHTLQTDIKEVRYLLLNNNYFDDTITYPDGSIGAYAFEMNNTTDIEIPVGTSHDVEIAEVKLTWMDYKNSVKREITLEEPTSTSSYYKYSDLAGYNESTKKTVFAGIEMDNSTSKLHLKRELLHILGSDSDPVWVEGHSEDRWIPWTWPPQYEQVWVEGHWEGEGASITENTAKNSYTFDIKLRHADDDSQTAMVRITQYPPIYITAEETKSSSYRFVNGSNQNGNLSDGLGSIGSKSNHYTYVLTISRFESGDNYVIADPRTRDVNNLPNNNGSPGAIASWSSKDSNNKQLQYYYPADDNDTKTRYIAPKLRVASQWGVTTVVKRDGAQRRCASYQENGRPAGRWRLPTMAEIEFIANLSCKGYIPYLFGDQGGSAHYWCASGAIKVTNSDNPTVEFTTGNEHYARCVYDEWYWGDDVLEDKEKFTWGDRPRTTSGN